MKKSDLKIKTLEPDIELRMALIAFYAEKYDATISFLVDYKIETVLTFFINYNEKKVKYYYVIPKIDRKKKIVSIPGIIPLSNADQKTKKTLCNMKSILHSNKKEPWPGFKNNKNPYSRKRHKGS